MKITAVGLRIGFETLAAQRLRGDTVVRRSISVSVARLSWVGGTVAVAAELPAIRNGECGNEFVFRHLVPAGDLVLFGPSSQSFACQSAKCSNGHKVESPSEWTDWVHWARRKEKTRSHQDRFGPFDRTGTRNDRVCESPADSRS